MPDRYDPKVSPRPAPDRRQGDASRSEPAMEDDPLAELAKIVQGRPTSASASSRGRGASANDQKPPSGGNAVSDLEAELLNDLQASFAAVREAAAAPTPSASPPMARTEPRQPQPVPGEETRAPAMFERPAAPAPAPARLEPRAEDRPEPQEASPPRFVPIPSPPVMQPPPVQRTEPQPPPERVSRAARPPLAGDPKADARTDVGGSFQLRSTSPVTPNAVPPPPQSRQPHSRWEKPEPAKPQPSGASRFAPPRGAPAPQPQPAFDDLDDDVDPFAEGGVFAQGAEAEREGEFPLDGFGLAPGYGDEEDLAEADDSFQAVAKPRRNRGLMVAGVVVGIALVGGVAFALLNQGGGTSTSTPPIITADGGPTKITPDDTSAATDDAQNKLIYDRINSADNGGDTTLITPSDGPIADVPTDTDSGNAISRVIIPGGPGIDAPQTDDALRLDEQPGAVTPPAADAPAGNSTDVATNDTNVDPDAIQPIGPRKVRTVVVKPDGTIVSSDATDAPTADIASANPPATDASATTTPPAVETAPAPVVDDTIAIAGNQGSELPITPVPDATATDAPTATAEAPPVATEPAATIAPPKAVVAETPQPRPPKAVASNDQPIDLTSAAPPATQAAAGGTLVQISSQRSEDAARTTYRDLQARYPRILGSFDANIQRADIPDRGTFYRVRVGPFSAGDAQRLCDDLKSAGGDCVLAKR